MVTKGTFAAIGPIGIDALPIVYRYGFFALIHVLSIGGENSEQQSNFLETQGKLWLFHCLVNEMHYNINIQYNNIIGI